MERFVGKIPDKTFYLELKSLFFRERNAPRVRTLVGKIGTAQLASKLNSMHLELVTREPLAIQIHLATVVPAFFLGTWLLFLSAKGSPSHRALGYLYVSLMTVTAFAAMFIRSLNPGHLSWIHIFIPLTLFGLVSAIWRIRRKDIKGHRAAMMGVYFGGLIIAGGLTFYPGRLMYRLFFG